MSSQGCAQCGGVVQVTESNGGIENGPFTETWECLECGATGRVEGQAEEPPRMWSYMGSVFGE